MPQAYTQKYAADSQSFRNVTIGNCRGIGLYIHGGDANASAFFKYWRT